MGNLLPSRGAADWQVDFVRVADCRHLPRSLNRPLDSEIEIPLPPELERFWRTGDGLTACERAEAYGIDLSLLDENLRLSPLERATQNDSAWEFARQLREAKANGIP